MTRFNKSITASDEVYYLQKLKSIVTSESIVRYYTTLPSAQDLTCGLLKSGCKNGGVQN